MSDPQLAAKLFRGFGDVSRLQVLEALRDGPQCVGAIVEQTGLTQPNVSMHLACLAECGLVTRERRGKFVDYAIADKRVVRVLDGVDELLLQVGPLIAVCPRHRGPARQRTMVAGKRRTR